MLGATLLATGGCEKAPEDFTIDASIGKPMIDASVELDAGAGEILIPDASLDELGQALQFDGVQASSRRADLIFPLACRHGLECSEPVTTGDCVPGTRATYDRGVERGFSDACLDSTLDLYACFANVDCSRFRENCSSFADTQRVHCGQWLGDAGIE